MTELNAATRLVATASSMPVTHLPDGTVIQLSEGSSFSKAHTPFVAKEGAWHELHPLAHAHGKLDSTLKHGGKVIADKQMAAHAADVSLVREGESDQHIASLTKLESLPVGAVVGRGEKTATKTAAGWEYDGQVYDVKHMDGWTSLGAKRIK